MPCQIDTQLFKNLFSLQNRKQCRYTSRDTLVFVSWKPLLIIHLFLTDLLLKWATLQISDTRYTTVQKLVCMAKSQTMQKCKYSVEIFLLLYLGNLTNFYVFKKTHFEMGNPVEISDRYTTVQKLVRIAKSQTMRQRHKLLIVVGKKNVLCVYFKTNKYISLLCLMFHSLFGDEDLNTTDMQSF